VLGASPLPPTLSSTFVSGIIASNVYWGLAPPGQFVGMMATDSVAQNTLLVANESIFDLNVLKLYQTIVDPSRGAQFEYISSQQKCTPSALEEQYFAWFGWLPSATFVGEGVIQETVCNVWMINATDSHGNGDLLIAYVSAADPGLPVRLVTSGSDNQMTNIIDFYDYQPIQPPEPYFDIPAYCVQSEQDEEVVARSHARLAAFRALTDSVHRTIATCSKAVAGMTAATA